MGLHIEIGPKTARETADFGSCVWGSLEVAKAAYGARPLPGVLSSGGTDAHAREENKILFCERVVKFIREGFVPDHPGQSNQAAHER